MTPIVIPSLYLLGGISAYAAINHLFAGLRRPRDPLHLVFAAMCALAVAFAFSHAQTLQAATLGDYVPWLKWNIASALSIMLLLPWFIALYSGHRALPLRVGLSALLAVLILVNLIQPYSLQYDAIDQIKTLRMPWGEQVSHAVAHNGAWVYVAVGSIFTGFVYALYALVALYRRTRGRAELCMLLALGLFVCNSILGILVRLGLIDIVEPGPFGFLAMIIVMSLVLSQQTQQRLRASERRFRALVEQSPSSIQLLAPDGRTLQVNAAWEKLWGVRASAIASYNIFEDRQLVEKGVMPHIRRGLAGTATEIPPIVYDPADNPALRGPRRERWVRAFIYPIKDEAGEIREGVLVHEDVTEKKRVEDAIRRIAAGVSAESGESFFQQLVLSLAGMFDAEYAFIGLLDEQDAQRINTLALCAHGEIAPNLGYALAGTPCGKVLGAGSCAYPRDAQQLFPQDPRLAEMGVQGYIGTPLFDAQDKPIGLLAVLDGKPIERIEQMDDILQIFAARTGAELRRLRAEAKIRRMAYQDYLTGLASRAHLHERLSAALRQVRLSGEGGALLLIDLDHFKTINDALGHDVGDEVLRAVGRRFAEAVAGHAFAARLGGDEFVALMITDTRRTQQAEQNAQDLAQKIMQKLTSPVFVGERALNVGASIGIALFPDNGETELDVMRHADMALYRAKSLGRGIIQFYLPSLQAAATDRLRLEEGLRRAIVNDELELYFQPQVDAGGGMVGAEALLRWHHPELGDIPPATFIPVAEESGLIHGIGGWVLEQACAHLTQWRRNGVGFVGQLSVNVCPWQFARPDFVAQVRNILAVYQLDPRHLMLELTESALLYDLAEAVEKLTALRALGLRVALDDFGTGYSSLAYLKHLPLDLIKIDQAFVAELATLAEHPLVESMIAIGRHMRLEVIAEGVETVTQRDVLVKLGCENFQGFWCGRPMPEQAFLAWIARNRAQAES